MEEDNNERVILGAKKYRVIDIHRRKKIYIMGQRSKNKVLKQVETLKTNDEVKFLDYLHEHHFQSMFIATLSLLFLVTLNIYILVVKTILTFY